jgi:hypothetical protein
LVLQEQLDILGAHEYRGEINGSFQSVESDLPAAKDGLSGDFARGPVRP